GELGVGEGHRVRAVEREHGPPVQREKVPVIQGAWNRLVVRHVTPGLRFCVLQGLSMIGQSPVVPEDEDAPEAAPSLDKDAAKAPPREIGGREGPEPTRYGDWEKNGRCIDF